MLNEEYLDEDIWEENPADPADKEIQEARVVTLLSDAEKYRQNGAYGIEAQLLAHALKLHPEDTMIWNKLGRAYRSAGFADKAVECYQRVLQLNPQDPWAYANIGAVYIAQENFSSACDYYAKAMAMIELQGKESGQSQNKRDYATVLANYAFALGKNGDKRQAAHLLKEAERLGYANGAAIRKQLKFSIFDKLF